MRAPNINRVILAGRITGEARQLSESVAKVSLAINRNIKRGDEWKTDTTFVNLIGFGRTAERLTTLEKGTPIVIMGRLQSSEWTNSMGQTQRSLEVVIEQLQVLGKQQRENDTVPDEVKPEDEELPF